MEFQQGLIENMASTDITGLEQYEGQCAFGLERCIKSLLGLFRSSKEMSMPNSEEVYCSIIEEANKFTQEHIDILQNC